MADILKRKVHLSINLYETENSNRLKTGDPVTATVLPGGAQVETSGTVPAPGGGTLSVTLSGRGEFRDDGTSINAVQVLRETEAGSGVWTAIAPAATTILQNLAEKASDPGSFEGTLNNAAGSAFDIQAGDRLAALTSSPATLYEDEAADADTVANPIDIPASGMISFYVEHDSVDVYLSGDTITDGFYVFNVPAYAGSLGPLNLRSESSGVIPASGDVAIKADTSLLTVGDSSNTIDSIAHGRTNRVLMLLPTTSGVQISTTNTQADNTIYSAAPDLITLDENVPIFLVARSGVGAGSFYWAIVGTPNTVDFNLEDLSDVTAGEPTAREILMWNGTAWEPSTQIGTATNPATSIRVTDGEFYIQAGPTVTASFDAGALTASRVLTIPDASGEILLTNSSEDIVGQKAFVAGASGFRLYDPTDTNKRVLFDLSGISAATSWTLTMPDKSGTIALLSDVKQSLNTLSDTSVGSPNDGDIVRYNSGTGNWEASRRPGNLRSTVTRDFFFDNPASTPAWGLYKQLQDVRNGLIIMRVPSNVDGSITIKRIILGWANVSTGPGVGPVTFELYHAASMPLTTTAPPAGTAITGVTIIAPQVTGANEQEITSFSDDTVPADNYIYLAISGGTLAPDDEGMLSISIDYEAEYTT